MPSPIAVLISDCHYSLNTLELADKAFRMAIDKADELNIPLIDCGDITNDKAILRAEVVNRLLATMKYAKNKTVSVNLLVGNHSLCNEKGKEHALEFLYKHTSNVIDRPWGKAPLFFIPYCSNNEDFIKALELVPKGAIIIAHQGFQGAAMGHYVKDTSSVPLEAVKDHRVITGHYHARQDIGTVSYVGNPYTLTFGEAKDPEKGFQILMDDGTLEFVPTNLRKHVILEFEIGNPKPFQKPTPDDLVWVKVTGMTSDLNNLKKSGVAEFIGREDFKLDKIYLDTPKLEEKTDAMTGEQVLDLLIEGLPDSLEYRNYLKNLWREL